MIVYYKTCQVCYKLLPDNTIFMRDTEKIQRFQWGDGKELTCFPGDTITVTHKECNLR